MARKNVSAIISGAGWACDFVGQLIGGLAAKGHTPEEIHSLVTAKQRPAMERIVNEVSSFLRGLENIFPLTINYAISLAEAIAKGKYDSVSSDITANHFPGAGVDTAKLEAQLVHFDRIMESNDVLKELDQAGLRPATLQELLAFGEQHPDTQRQFPIVALGSVWQDRDGRRSIPALWSYAGGRGLYLRWCDYGWFGSCRFLAFRK